MTDAHPRSLAAHVGATHALQQAMPTCTEKGQVLARTSQPCRISSLSIYKDPASFAAALLLVDTWNDMVTEAVYQADLAGLSSHISVDADGIEVVVAGFSDRLPTLVSSLFQVGSVFDVCKASMRASVSRVQKGPKTFLTTPDKRLFCWTKHSHHVLAIVCQMQSWIGCFEARRA
jgi:hypothetical protein